MIFSKKTLIKENEWLRVYEVGPKQLLYESKFVRDNLQVSAEGIKSRWRNFTDAEKHDFVTAFQAKHPLTTDDEEIFEFLMDVGDEDIWNMIALPATRMSATKRIHVLEFLLDRVSHSNELRANYYQALSELNDRRAVPTLKSALTEDRKRINFEQPLESFEGIFPYTDYLQCCAALYRLEGSEEYKQAILQMQNHPDETVRAKAKLVLSP
jgi:hypothetical protein